MTNTQHTLGPWRVEIENTGTTTICTDDDLIAELPTSDPENVNPANARLIAAAPDLLAALQAVADYLDLIDHMRHAQRGNAAAVRAAIAKATGQ